MRFRTLTGLALLSVVSTVEADEPIHPSSAPTESPQRQDNDGQSHRSIAERFAQMLAEFESQSSDSRQARAKAESQPAEVVAGAKRPPDEVAYSRRMVDLAESSPDDPAARDFSDSRASRSPCSASTARMTKTPPDKSWNASE